MQRLCFFVLCAYLLSASANDIALHVFHIKAYLSTVAVVLLPVVFFASGTAGQGGATPLAGWWAGFAIWLALCAPFSVWRGDTVNLLANYFLRDYALYFVICACVVSTRQLRTFMRVLGLGAILVVLTCIAFGANDGDRFAIPGSPFFSNANELGLQLLLGMIFLSFSFTRKGAWTKLMSAAAMLVSAGYMLKTGSRGVLLAAAAVCLLLVMLSRKRSKFVLIALPAFLLTFALTPGHTRHRLTLILASPGAANIHTAEDVAAVGSQMQREQLLRESIAFAFRHPLTGVGPGQFMTAQAGEKQKEGGNADWRGTHNTYTQIASETGLPGFIFYTGALLTCLRISFRLHRRLVREKGLEELAGVSFCMLIGAVGYAISTFFFHIAYSYYLPILAGVSGAIHLIAKRALQEHSPRNRLRASVRI